MKKQNKNAPQTLTGQRGAYQIDGKNNNTISKELLILNWLYDRTKQGLTCTAFDSFSHNLDTSFRTHISVLCRKHGLEINRRYITNPNTGSTYKEYWLSDDDVIKVKKTLNKGVGNG